MQNEASEESKAFILYLMKFGEEKLKEKIKKRLESRGASVTITEEDIDEEESKIFHFLNI